MIATLVEFSLRQRILVLGLACLLSLVGVFAFQSIPIDAYPDVTNIQVQVLTEAPGLSPVEVERFITYPLELQMTGLPGLAEIRSLSKFALSQITVVFNDDVDIYFARQLVLERIMAAKERLPEGLEPVMAPVTTGLGEVYHYYVEGPHTTATDPKVVEEELTDQRTMQDWVLRPLLKSVPGVIDVNGMGGFVKQYQVLVDPAKLRKFDLTLHHIYEAVAKNNANVGGNVLERYAERSIVRGLGLIKSVSDIESIIVKESGGTPVFVRDVAEVLIGHAVRHGAVVLNGEREVVIGTVLMIRGGNARHVVEAVKAKVAIGRSLEGLAGMMKSSITELQGMMGGEMGQSMQQLRQSAAGGEGQMRATLDLAKEMGSGIARQQEMRKARGAMLFQEYKKKMGMVQPEVAATAQALPKPPEKQKIAE